jgi:hypothetical protein
MLLRSDELSNRKKKTEENTIVALKSHNAM